MNNFNKPSNIYKRNIKLLLLFNILYLYINKALIRDI